MTDKEALLERGIELAQAHETEEARAIFAALAADPDCSSFHLDVFAPTSLFSFFSVANQNERGS